MTGNVSSGPRVAALALVIVGAIGAIGWLWWTAAHPADTNFLPATSPAGWIVSPYVPEMAPHPRVKLDTVFKRSFVLPATPGKAGLRVAGFNDYSVTVNGVASTAPLQAGRNWKRPDRFDVTRLLRAGDNEIAFRVSNTNGPAALWLSLVADGFSLNSDESWQASCAGAEWAATRFATRPPPAVTGGPLSGGERPSAAFRARWLTFSIFALLSAVAYWFIVRWEKSQTGGDDGNSAKRLRREVVPLLALAGLWVVLFVNNLSSLPPLTGFDVEGHVAYVNYILERHALPFANEGWEMFQPPLYYLACAGVLKILGLHAWQDGAITALRILGLLVGVAHFVIVWACLRLLFPADRSRQMWGTLLAACLPVVLYLSQYITNEAAAAAAVSACVFLTLRVLKSNPASWRLCAALGICLGAAMLTKITAALFAPLIIVALFWKRAAPANVPMFRRGARVALVLALAALVCGWHYTRAWKHFGHSSAAAWFPVSEIVWWQENGYRTGAFYLRFGEALVHPWFSAFRGFPDGIYSTLWGDGLLGGSGDFALRPPWNYDLMAAGYWLALLPTMGLVIGAAMAVAGFIRRPTAEWFLLLGLGFLAALAVTRLSLTVPFCSMVKAFYGLSALVPFCALGALGLDFLSRRAGRLRPTLCVLFGVWAINSFAAFFVSGSSTDTMLSRARALAKAGRINDAMQTIGEGLQSNPQSAELHCLFSEILLQADQVQDAINHAELAVSQNPNDVESLLALAAALAQQGQLDEAAAAAQKAVELSPGKVQAWSQFATLLARQEKYEEAERAARAGLAVSPFNAELRLQLGATLIARHQDAEGMAQLHLAAELKAGSSETTQQSKAATSEIAVAPDSPETRPALATAAALLAQGDVAQAINQYQAILKTVPDSAEARCGLGQALGKQGRLEEAAGQYEQVLKSRPDNASALLQLGILRAKQGKSDEAAKALSEAARLRPDDALPRNYLGNVLAQQGRPEEAATQFETALRLNPDLALAHNNLAITCKKLGRTADAIKHYREAIRLQPDFVEALNNLAWLLATHADAQFRNGADAVNLAARACELTRYQKPMALATLAAACAETGRFADAVSDAEQAQQLAGGQGPLAAMLPAMLENFRLRQPYRAN